MIYNLIGRLTVRVFLSFFRQRADPAIVALVGVGAVAGIAAVGVVGYLATRDVPEA